MPEATRLGRVRLQVADLARSLEFYTTVLGLEATRQGGGQAVLTAGGGREPLIELVELPGARPAPPHGRLGLFHFAILLPERRSLGRFARHLAESGQPAGASDHLVSEAFYLHDPDGLGIEVYADRPRHSWRSQEGQLLMDTRPLDVRSLLAQAGDERWTGMPAGSTVGHVHLHVGDLDQAAAFYHHGLGFDLAVWSYPGALFLSAGGYHHHLGVNTWASGARPADEEDARLIEWELLVPTASDAKRAARGLGDAGHPVVHENGRWLTTDPWGVGLRISY